jgi:hypothetical protein
MAGGVTATVPGGALNIANGEDSFAAGERAQALHEGTFVWSDSSGTDFASTGVNQFLVRASGGTGIGTHSPSSVLHVDGGNDASLTSHGFLITGDVGSANLVLDSNEVIARFNGAAANLLLNNGSGNVGIKRASASHPVHVGSDSTNGNGAHCTVGGVWTNGSDRESKKNIEQISKQEILEKVAALPVTRWQYKGEPESIHHIGPVAQDFYEAFGTGGDDRYIGTIDADGVAFAAIQGLHQLVQEKDCEIEELRSKVSELQDVQVRLMRLEAMLGAATMDADVSR